MDRALLIAEKPSLRRTIEAVYNKHKSEIPYDCTFMEQRGHLLTLKQPDEIDEDMKEWSWDNLPFVPEEHGGFKYKVIKEKKVGSFPTSQERFKAIKEELNSGDYDFVINAGDPEQEGELLIRIVLSAAGCKLPIKRYWSNDTTEEKVFDALKNLRDDENDPMLKNLLYAAFARQHSDYRVGMNLSRAATLKLGGRVALGRVKTPIMAIVCHREEEIANFKPSTSYGVKAEYEAGFDGQYYVKPDETSSSDSEKKKDDDERGLVYFDTKEEAEEFIKNLDKKAEVVSYESKKTETYAPALFKLATIQVAASRLGYTSDETLDIIQSLYEKGYLSYPRTDCEFLSSHEDFDAMIESASADPSVAPYATKIEASAIGRVRKTKKWVDDKQLEKSGHSALVPTAKKPDYDELTTDEKKIYDLVARRFIAIFMPPLVQNRAVLFTDISGNLFKSTGKTLVSPGYTELFGAKTTDKELPPQTKGDILDVSEFSFAEKTTKCPKRFTDGDLIAVCENPQKYLRDKSLKSLGKSLKIGTPATRSSIISDSLINKDKYLQRKKFGKTEYIIPTERGMSIYQNIHDFEICRVDMTGYWEEELEKIRAGELTLPDMENKMKDNVREMVFEIKNADMTGKPSISEMKSVAVCPKCGRNIISGPKSYYCEGYKDGCKVGAWKKICESTLTDDEFLKMLNGEHIEKTIKNKGKSWKQKLHLNLDEGKVEFDARETERTSFVCPKCGKELTRIGRKLSCECGFELWTTVGANAKVLPDNQIEKLLNEGQTDEITGIKSKKGKIFGAIIRMKDDYSGTEFVFNDSGSRKGGYKKSAPSEEETDFVCPKCRQHNLVRNGRKLSCECGFTMWTRIGVNKDLTDDQIQSLIDNNDSGVITGIISKKGKEFSASLSFKPDYSGYEYHFDDGGSESEVKEVPEKKHYPKRGRGAFAETHGDELLDKAVDKAVEKSVFGNESKEDFVNSLLGKK